MSAYAHQAAMQAELMRQHLFMMNMERQREDEEKREEEAANRDASHRAIEEIEE